MQLIGASLRDAVARQPHAGRSRRRRAGRHAVRACWRACAPSASSRCASASAELFADMRLLWPALGATAAVVAVRAACACSVWQARQRRAARLAGGDDRRRWPIPAPTSNPLRLERTTASRCRVRARRRLARCAARAACRTTTWCIAVRSGRHARGHASSNYELLLAERRRPQRRVAARASGSAWSAVLNAVQQSRFAPAQTPRRSGGGGQHGVAARARRRR